MTGARTTVVPVVATGTPGIVFGKNVTAPVTLSYPSASGSASASVFTYSGGVYSGSSSNVGSSSSSSPTSSEESSAYEPEQTQASSTSAQSGDVFASAQESAGIKLTLGRFSIFVSVMAAAVFLI
ncbi:hypothetical protein PG996_000028 [Apiospora saccharicola]|uniref:REJ domain-containing protein n=1 Tax=Apiospora saccharicola TaxID=335842 RepID=A0ABR1WDZ8_9PEZI